MRTLTSSTQGWSTSPQTRRSEFEHHMQLKFSSFWIQSCSNRSQSRSNALHLSTRIGHLVMVSTVSLEILALLFRLLQMLRTTASMMFSGSSTIISKRWLFWTSSCCKWADMVISNCWLHLMMAAFSMVLQDRLFLIWKRTSKSNLILMSKSVKYRSTS